MWRVVCDQETSNIRRLKPAPGLENTTTMGCNARKTNKQQDKHPTADDLVVCKTRQMSGSRSLDYRLSVKAHGATIQIPATKNV
jgi:hypothetical protein